jgi:nucleoside-diphosphate-sugar epimerase
MSGQFWQGRHVLVTGGCGFIGSHLVERLAQLGARVRVLDRYGVASPWDEGRFEPGSVELMLGDVADPYFTRRATAGVDTVFHLAALIGIPYSYVAPAHYVRTNVDGALAVLEAAREEGIRRLVHTSTSEVYGSARYTPMDEAHPLSAQSPYAATKIAADQLAASYFDSFDVPVTTLRPFNTYGPRQSLRAVLPTMMGQALYADEIVVGSLEPVRDMNYVFDTVGAFLAIAAADGVDGEVYNVGSGVPRSVGELAAAVQRVAGTDKPVRSDEERLRPQRSEVRELHCDFAKAAAAFGYAPSVELEEGLARLRDELVLAAPAEPTRYHI